MLQQYVFEDEEKFSYMFLNFTRLVEEHTENIYPS